MVCLRHWTCLTRPITQVTAASLNYADALVLQGQYQEKPALPFTPGGEVSGTVVELGSAVRGLTVGDAVLAVLPRFGGFATEVVASARDCFVVSPRLNLVAASGLAVAYGTAEVALSHRCRVAHGHTVLVLGAAGGVGLAAVQVAKALGARVIAVARGTAKCAALRSRESPHLVIDSETLYKERTLKQAIAAVAPKGVHCIFDPVGGSMLTEAMKCAAWGCQIALIGFASGEIPKLSANVLLVKNLTAHGVYWGSYAQHQPDVLRDSLARLAGWMEDGIVNVRVSHALPMEKAHEAFRALLRREAIGKVVLVPGERAKL